MENIDKIKEIIAGVCSITPDKIIETTSIGDFPQWDSMGHLAILSNVEETFDISFEPEEMMDLEDVADIVKAVNDKL